MDEAEKALLERIRAELAANHRGEAWACAGAHLCLWLSILASFGAAIVATMESAPRLLVAILAAIPGTAIVFERTSMLTARWRWHCAAQTRLQAFERQLLYEGANARQVSEELSDYWVRMQEKYPAGKAEGLSPKILRPNKGQQ